jgi:hypothetical protein
MPAHFWGDEDFDWNSLYKAEKELRRTMKRYGRIGVHSKEKYGSLRFDLFFCDGTLHSLTHSGYVYSQYPEWLWRFDQDYQPLRLLTPVINFWQKLVLQYAFTVVCAKYPHIRDEIINNAPKELLPCDLAIACAKMWCSSCSHCGELSTSDNYKCPHCGEVK